MMRSLGVGDLVHASMRRKEEEAHQQVHDQEAPSFKVVVDGDDGGVAMRQVHERISRALELRGKYKDTRPIAASSVLNRLSGKAAVTCLNGIYSVAGHRVSEFYGMNPWSVFATDAEQIRLTIGNSQCAKACAHRLKIIQERSRTFFLLNNEIEDRQTYHKGGGVLGLANRVDCSVKLTHPLTAQELLELVIETYHSSPDEVVGRNADRPQESLTLRQLFESQGMADPSVLTTEALGWCSPHQARTRNMETNPLQFLSQALWKTFLSFDGPFTPRVLKRVLTKNEGAATGAPQATEFCIPLYCRTPAELVDVATFLKRNEIGPFQRNMWVLQLRFHDPAPSGAADECRTVQDQLDALFLPLIHATLNVDDPSYSSVSWLLFQTGALQIESSNTDPATDFEKKLCPPQSMLCETKPSKLYYAYYIHANLNVLNSIRRRKGMNTIQMRVSGNDGHLDTVVASYMFADVLTQARLLTQYPVAQYLMGMHRIGLTVSPLHDSSTAHSLYSNHPLPLFLHRCLNVTVATEMPLHHHHDVNALREEYGTAQKLFRLSALDVAEMCRNSVMMSSFAHLTKASWLGDGYQKANFFRLSHVTNTRLQFRFEAWANESEMLKDLYPSTKPNVVSTSHRRSIVPSRVTGSGPSKWHVLSSVKDVEYFAVLDNRIRFPRTVISGPHKDDPIAQVAAPKIARALALREKYMWKPPNPWEAGREKSAEDDFAKRTATFNEDDWVYDGSDAVILPFPRSSLHSWPKELPTIEQFERDFRELKGICDSVDVKDFARRRLELLDHKFMLHLALNHANEAGMTENQASTNRDIYQAVKVDTHIHMAAGMTPRQMLQFLRSKMEGSPDDIVLNRRGEILTLRSLCSESGIGAQMTVDQLSVQADHTLFERFDNFNNRYNPMENPDLRTILLKTDNYMNGRYFAELIRNCFAQYSRDKSTYAENRLSVYGISPGEWSKLAGWFDTHGMSSKHNKWIIQIPRVYKVFRGFNTIGSFGQYLDNIFRPLWEASLHPSEHPSVHNFLKHVSGFDSVDNEATIDLPLTTVSPWAWTAKENPPYNYYLYYLFANIRSLNEFRASRGFSTFDLRPHCGESGSDDHLTGAFLCAGAIGHGINLKNDPSMAYLYYLAQVGLHVAPLSNNALFLRFTENPFHEFFRQGLHVSLSTDDPLMFHQTEEPLIEEYSIAARYWGLSPNDLCEIARNSVLQSGFDHSFKRSAIGDRWYMSSSLGNDPHRTHLSDIRVAYRFETYHTEVSYLESVSGASITRAMRTTHQEQEINERQIWSKPEEILLSTHDQGMETALRDIDEMRGQIRAAKARVEALRRQQRSLVGSLADLAVRQKEERDAEARSKGPTLTYERRSAGVRATVPPAPPVPTVVEFRPQSTPPTAGRPSWGRPLPKDLD